VAEANGLASINPDTRVSLIQVADGRTTPLGIGTGSFRPIGWSNDETVIVETIGDPDPGRVTGYLSVPISDPQSLRAIVGPEEAISYYAYLSPDRTRLLYLAGMDETGDGGDLTLVETSGAGGAPIQLAPGTKAGSAGFAWSPDGAQVVFHEIGGSLWIVNSDGSGLREIASGEITMVDSPWQPVPVP
jgi:hypothetical protein